MLPWEINDELFDRNRKVIAAGLHVSPSLVDGWTRPPHPIGDGEHSPLERFVEIARILERIEAGRGERFLGYANTELGFLPPVRIAPMASAECERGETVRAFGELLIAHAEVMADGRLTLAEKKRLVEDNIEVQACLARECARWVAEIKQEEEQGAEQASPGHPGGFFELRRAAG